MMRIGTTVLVVLLLVPAAGRAAKAADDPTPFTRPWTRLGANTLDAFWGWRTSLHLAGMAATGALVPTGADFEVHDYFNRHPRWGYAAYPGVIGGGVLPVLVPATLWGIGWWGEDHETLAGAYAAGQAVVLAYLYQTLLKAVTGRPPPEPGGTPEMRDVSMRFRWGFLRGGVFHGWPSGHAMVSTALVSSLAHYYRDTWWMQGIAWAWSGYMFYSVVSFDEGTMHWLSDAVAGTLMGYAIGSAVGSGMRGYVDGDETGGARLQWAPLAVPGATGLQLGGTF